MPERFGNYVVHERLGSGGMATVHRATLSGIGGFERSVALKRLLPHLAHDDAFVAAFVREARIAAQLRHLNVAATYDLGRVDESYYIAMELIEGDDLRKVLKQCASAAGPMPPWLVLNLVGQICDALSYAHALCDDSGEPLGIVHRDVSPANIIVSKDGTAKLIDFGIARASATSYMTMSGQLKGKFAYIAPETMRGEFDARADLFSLGVVAWELLTARPLFAGNDEIDTLNRIRQLEVPPPSVHSPSIPDDVDTIVMTALARDPAERWQSAGAMRGALGVVSSRQGLNATNADLAQWIEHCFAARPTGRARHVGFTGPHSVPPPRGKRDTDADARAPTLRAPDPADTMESTIEEDSIDISIMPNTPRPIPLPVAPPPSHVPVTAPGRAPASLGYGSSELESAESLGAAPASSDTLEMLVGGDLLDSRVSSAMRLVRRSADQAVTAPVREVDPGSSATLEEMARSTDAMTTPLPAVDLEASTGQFRLLGPEPSTLVDVPEHNILAEMPVPKPGAIRTIPGGANAPARPRHDSNRVATAPVTPRNPSRPSIDPLPPPPANPLAAIAPHAATMVADGTPRGTPQSGGEAPYPPSVRFAAMESRPPSIPSLGYPQLGPEYEAAAAAYRDSIATPVPHIDPRTGRPATAEPLPEYEALANTAPPRRRGVGVILALAICAAIGSAAAVAIYFS